MKRSLLALPMLCCIAAAGMATGCTKVQPPRSFVQPNALLKSDFNGVWYYNATVIEAPPTNGALYEGEYGELQKIKWVISEDTLFAVRAYPFVYGQEAAQTPGTPHGNVDGSDTYEGEPLAAWRITSHFDIIRDYNPSTGEETNRIIESQERPWNERQYMRVDWSKNLAPDYEGIGLDWTFNGVQLTDLTYYVSDPTSPDAMHIERATDADSDLGFKNGEMNFLDITAQVIAQPNSQEFVIDEAGNTMTLPTCFMYYATEDCAAQKVKLRHSFAKVAPNDTYEKRKWDGVDQNKFGFFTTTLRHFWDPIYGDTYSGDKRYVERFNLFKQSCKTPGTTCEAPHRVRDPQDATWLTKYTDKDLDPQGNVLATGRHLSEAQASSTNVNYPDGGVGPLLVTTTADGGALPIADDQFFYEGTDDVPLTVSIDGNGKTQFSGDDNWIPYDQRVQHTIPYYANQEMPEDIWKDSKEVINQWNKVFKVSYKDLTGTDASQDIFVWCHNPVKQTADNNGEADPAACLDHLKPEVDASGNTINGADGKPIYLVRQGDPRRSSILWLGQYQAGGPLGLGPAMADPETGETISAKANIYGGELNVYISWCRDVLQLLNGQIAPDQYILGTNVDAWVKQQEGLNGGQGLGTKPKPLTQQQLASEAGRMNFGWAKGANLGRMDMSSLKAFRNSLRNRESHLDRVFGPSTGNVQQAMLEKLRGTPLETRLATPELTMQNGLNPTRDFGNLSSAEKAMYSPLESPRIRLLRKQYVEKMESFGFDFDAFNYDVMKGEAARYANLSPDEVYKELRDRVFIAVTLHEVGHNMGLRHNFRGTFDAMNYFPDYWTQREAASAALGNPSDGQNGHILYARSNAKGALQANELLPHDIGPQAITDFNPGPVSELGQQYTSIMDYGAAFNTDSVGLGRYDVAAIKYGYANNVEVFTNASTDPKQMLRLASLQVFQDSYGFPSPILNTVDFFAVNYYTYPQMMTDGYKGLQERKDVSAYAIDDRPFVGQYQTVSHGRPITNYLPETMAAALDANGKILPQVPYYFCSDEFVGNLSCQRFDFGADAYEQAEDVISRYWNFYIINNFKRDRIRLNINYAGYIENRYFSILEQQMQWYVLLRADFVNFATQLGGNSSDVTSFLADDQGGWGSFTAAINDGFKLFGDVLTAPQAGSYLPTTNESGNAINTQFQDDPISGLTNVDITEGRYETTSWNYTGCGYYWGDECQQRIGYFVDKWLALETLADSQAYFTGRDTSVDVREYAIGYWLPYKEQILNMYGSLFANDTLKLAPYILGPGEGMARLDITNGTYHKDDGTPVSAPTGARVDPALGFSAQMWAGVWGISGFSSTFDQSFIDSTRVFVVGSGEAAQLGVSLLNADGTPGPLATTDPAQILGNGGTKEWLLWTDPLTSKTYAAHSSKPVQVGCQADSIPLGCTGTPLRQDIGARMLEHARMLYGRAQAAAPVDKDATMKYYTDFQENLDMMRSLHGAFGNGQYLEY